MAWEKKPTSIVWQLEGKENQRFIVNRTVCWLIAWVLMEDSLLSNDILLFASFVIQINYLTSLRLSFLVSKRATTTIHLTVALYRFNKIMHLKCLDSWLVSTYSYYFTLIKISYIIIILNLCLPIFYEYF